MARSQVIGLRKVGVMARQCSEGSGQRSCHLVPGNAVTCYSRARPPLCHFLVSVCSDTGTVRAAKGEWKGREQWVMHKATE